MNIKVKLSTLWIVVLFNMAFADILMFFEPGMLAQIMEGAVDGTQFTSTLMLVMAIVLEVPIIMILLSRILKYKANRLANIIAGAITILFVVGGGSTTPAYLFFGTVEVVCCLLIIWYAWKWQELESD